MKIINREPGGGKTTALVGMMFEPGNEDVVFVAPTKKQAIDIGLRTAVTVYGATQDAALRDRFISVSELDNRKGREERYVIDEIDGAIDFLVGGTVIAISGTDEDHKIAHRVKRGF